MATLNILNPFAEEEDEILQQEQQQPDLNGAKPKVGEIPADSRLEWTPLEFKSLGKVMRTTNDELARTIKEAYMESFHDLRGVNIVYAPPSGFIVELFFELNTEPLESGKIRNVIDLTEPNKDVDLFSMMQATQNKMNGKKYTLNDETKLLLSDCMFGGRNAKDNRPKSKAWDNRISEVHVSLTSYGDMMFNNKPRPERILVKVVGLDIKKVVQKLYGDDMIIKTVTDGNSDTNIHARARYDVRFIDVNPNGTFNIHIEQFDADAVKQFVLKKNPQIQMAPGIVMY